MKYAALFLLLSAGLLGLAISGGGLLLLLCWPAVSLALVGVAYAGVGPTVFGKSPRTGRLSILATALLLPYLLLTWATWHVLRLVSREPPYHRLDDDLYIGRRLLAHEYPAGIASVVDLTSEFNERLPRRNDIEYRLFACLDAAPLTVEQLHAIAVEVAALPRPLYVHCAQGHGRTAMVVAASLMTTRARPSAAAALDAITTARPGAVPSASQRRAVLALEASTLKGMAC